VRFAARRTSRRSAGNSSGCGYASRDHGGAQPVPAAHVARAEDALANIREGTSCCSRAPSARWAEQREVAGILRDNSLRLQRLIENLLSFSEWQANRSALEVSEFRLQPLVKSAIETYQLPSTHTACDSTCRSRTVAARGPLEAQAHPRQPHLECREVHARRRNDHGPGTSRRPARMVSTWPTPGPASRWTNGHAYSKRSTRARRRRAGCARHRDRTVVVQEFVHAHEGTVEILDGNSPARTSRCACR